ncbi:hypothetical protein Tco_0443905, partial [Tanacetum coccineum]
MILEHLPHRLNLSTRGIDILTISCPCNGNVESSNYIFFECELASEVWRRVRAWCEISFPVFISYVQLKDWLLSSNAPKDKAHRLYIIFASALWWIWRFRNSITFNSQPMRKSDNF